MKLMRLAMCVAVFAVVGGIAFSEDVDVRALQAQLKAQEARLADLQAKLNGGYSTGSDADALVSINKNARVTVGGQVNTRYWSRTAKIDAYQYDEMALPGGGTGMVISDTWRDPATGAQILDANGNPINSWGRKSKANQTTFEVSDANIFVKAEVNEYFEAYLQANLKSVDADRGQNAERAYVKWKNVCNSGFGVLVGRNELRFGDNTNGLGVMGSYAAGGGDGMGNISIWTNDPAGQHAALFPEYSGGELNTFAGYIPMHNSWDIGRIVQVNPYWEGMDGKLKFELSFFKASDAYTTYDYAPAAAGTGVAPYGQTYYKSNDYGFGTGTARVFFTPMEGLTFQASVLNLHRSHADNTGFNSNNTATSLSFSWRPAFFNRARVWAQWIHGWNVANFDNYDSDAITSGISFDITECLTAFAQYDYLRAKDGSFTGGNEDWYKGYAQAVYTGLQYNLPYGAQLEAGWKHEWVRHSYFGPKVSSGTADTIYGHVGFSF